MSWKQIYEKLKQKIQRLPKTINEVTLDSLENVQEGIESLAEDLENSEFKEKCLFFENFAEDIKFLVDQRQSLTRSLRNQTKSIEQKFSPFTRGLETLKQKCQDLIAEEIISNEEKYKNSEGVVHFVEGNLSIQESESRKIFKIKNVRQVPEGFLKLDEDAVLEFYNFYGDIPNGVEVIEKRRFTITRLRKKG